MRGSIRLDGRGTQRRWRRFESIGVGGRSPSTAPRPAPIGERGLGARSVLLDLDAILAHSREAHAKSWADALRARGISVPLERIRPLIGMEPDRLLTQLTGIPWESPLGRRVREARLLLFRLDQLQNLRPLPRAVDLLERIRAESLRLAAACALPRADLVSAIAATGLGPFDLLVGLEDLTPGHDVVAEAVRRLDASPSEILVLGDNPYVLGAAARVGASSIALRSGGWDEAALSTAAAIYRDPADLLERFRDSPLTGDGSGASEWHV